jgi:hypothetical protein
VIVGRTSIDFDDTFFVVILALVAVAACSLLVLELDDCCRVILALVSDGVDKSAVVEEREVGDEVVLTGVATVESGESGAVRSNTTVAGSEWALVLPTIAVAVAA